MSKGRVFSGVRIKEENAVKIDEIIGHFQGQISLGSVHKQDVMDLAIEKLHEEIFPGSVITRA
ncbi:hypothetical protein [Oceanobacillus saliphilus]|uniref:hypothetical protein n=1 Tax=Oceanobacillus saliphilus TaxID=2925834 RepID=UPI00201E11E2|nr:hypothetical protein [Oceanobacillus saliphilus]